MRILPALLLLAPLAAAAAPQPKAAGGPPDLAARPGAAPGHGGDTRCAACHTAEGWGQVKFAHERTGFPLEGRHRDVQCRACHASGTFAEPVPRACAACHRDVHQGKLGQRCQQCHDAVAWSEPTFGPDAHRRTAFPLTGRHAVTPCEECHGDRRDRAFQRPTVACIGCHEEDWVRASSGGASVDHDQAGFPQDCRRCHGPWSFSPATLPGHEACFAITSGPHVRYPCLRCHTGGVPQVDYGQPFTCTSVPDPNCIGCHGTVAGEHQGVAGYQPVNRKCYECHRFASVD